MQEAFKYLNRAEAGITVTSDEIPANVMRAIDLIQSIMAEEQMHNNQQLENQFRGQGGM